MWPLDAGKATEVGFPLEPPGGRSPANTLALTQKGPFGVSDLQNRKKINLFCSKPLILWQFLAAAVGSSHSLTAVPSGHYSSSLGKK